MAKEFRKTFLTKVRFISKNVEKVEKSIFQYAEVFPDVYGLSIIGIINGFLPFIGLVLVANVDKETNTVKGYRITKKWW